MIPVRTADEAVLATVRRILFGAFVAGIVGTGTELVLLGHFETAYQAIPLAALALGLAAAVWQAAAPRAASVRALQVVAVLFAAAGALGVGLHVQGNSAFELEMYPEAQGLALIGATLAGATPVLAPGSMALLGLIAAAYTYGHPALHDREHSPL
jgi:hypothetical protein